mgnify:FL=1
MTKDEEISYAELLTLNRATVIFASSLDVDTVFARFINELRKELDIDWAALVQNEGTQIRVLGFTGNIDSKWKVGERINTAGTVAEWVINNQRSLMETDIVKRQHSYIAEPYSLKEIRSVACFPLVVNEKVIGCFTVASRKPAASTSAT